MLEAQTALVAILLVAGGKAAISEKKFYKALTAKADARFERHLARVKAETRTGSKGRKK